MNRKAKRLITVVICIIVAINLTFILKGNQLKLPKVEELSSITFINIVQGQVVEKITISQQSDINSLLNILRNSKKTDKESTSDFPNKTKFTTIIFNFTEGGSSIASIYKEDDTIYLEQPYVGIFKVSSKDFNINNVLYKLWG